MIYLDSAATSLLKPPQVARAVAHAITTLGNDSRGTHRASLASSRTVFETRMLLAEFFHVEGPEQVVFTANATQALNIAVKGILSPGDRVVSTVMEHNSVLRPLWEMEQRGVCVTYVSCRKDGTLREEELLRSITPEVRAVFCTHASNLTGVINDIEKIGKRCRETGTLLCVDASQTAGVIPIDMEKMKIDILCFTGHKGLMGPQGTGGMCVRKGLEIRPLLTGGSGIRTYEKEHPVQMPTHLEAGTLNVHGIAGLHAAVREIRQIGLDNIQTRERSLMDQFLQGISDIPQISILGTTKTEQHMPLVSLNVGDLDSGVVSDWLAQEYDICTRPGGHCAPRMHEVMGTRRQGAVRYSFSYYNTEKEIEQAAEALRILCAGE